MSLAKQVAKHFRDVHFGGNWTSVNLKDTLADVSWQQATTKVQSFNTIATLVYHTNYYVKVVERVIQGGPLAGKDKESFEHPPVESQEDWDNLLTRVWTEAEQFASIVEQLPDDTFFENFSDGKYGNYYRNIMGVIEHLHYHLGQMVLIKKLFNN